MSILFASNIRRMMSQRGANHLITSSYEYCRSTVCFRPARIPGVSAHAWSHAGASGRAPHYARVVGPSRARRIAREARRGEGQGWGSAGPGQGQGWGGESSVGQRTDKRTPLCKLRGHLAATEA